MLPRMKHVLIYLTFMLGVLLPIGFTAPHLEIESPAKQIATDQSVSLKVRLEWSQSEGPYEINSLEPKLENLTLENQNQSQESGDMVSQTLFYEFRPIKTGTAVIYPFEISYRKTETDPWTPILVPEQKIKVVPSIPLKATLIWLLMAAGLSTATFAGFKLWRILKSRETAKNAPPSDPKQRIYAKAEESIATFTSPDSKSKLTHWSNQLRTVVVTYYDISSTTTTSAEILSFLKTRGIPTGEWNEVSRLFGQLTEMQFSRQDIPAYDLDRMEKTLLQYVKGKIIIGNSNA